MKYKKRAVKNNILLQQQLLLQLVQPLPIVGAGRIKW
jgi:hypothetical protein